jgi:hypothetical protein
MLTKARLAAGAKQQVENGDNSAEKPMWGETGGLDFDGRERWEAWNKMQVRARSEERAPGLRRRAMPYARARRQGMSKAEAQKAFCDAYGRAQSQPDENFRKY